MASGNGSVLPTHTAAPSAPAWPSSSSKMDTKEDPSRRRRCLCVCLLVTLAVLLALAITLLVLFLTVLKVRDPTTRLVSTRLAGVAPRLSFPAMSVQLNVTLLLTVGVHNPNPASFDYDAGGHSDLTYRGAHVGDAQIDPGRIPSKGDGEVKLALTLQADRFADDLMQLLADVEAGSIAMEASTRIPGRVTVLGIFKRHAVAYSDCSFVFGVAEMGVRSQQCHDRTKL
ncbi:hypothetical protein HU200_030538 [Digitaria exilis]|uniref:Late embryogenesis abundant protein LEA-2 subgroup domain-containing protein n=1 Tax=Digitaria exilis TaxID=1010633 RepID=A0A835ER04_9POAL|nr:hypothetical protein HU200_030538 [Digitaria exilis]CAB3462895.1 unnamed protein product [Digitaria exilis]